MSYRTGKQSYDGITKRLQSCFNALKNGDTLVVADLAEKFNVSEKTIKRDFKKLEIMYPVTRDDQGNMTLQKGKKLTAQQPGDEITCMILETIAQDIGGDIYKSTKKLLDTFKNQKDNPVYTKLNITDITNSPKDIQIIKTCIEEKIELEYTYNRQNITIQPLKIVNFEGFWYLIALHNDKLMKYYLENIIKPQQTENSFSVKHSITKSLDNSVTIWFEIDTEPFEVKLFANKVAAKYFKRKPLPTQYIEGEDSNGMVFSVSITHMMELIPLVKYWIPHLFIIEPQDMKEKIKKDLQAYLDEMDIYTDEINLTN